MSFPFQNILCYQSSDFFQVEAEIIEETPTDDEDIEGLSRSVVTHLPAETQRGTPQKLPKTFKLMAKISPVCRYCSRQ